MFKKRQKSRNLFSDAFSLKNHRGLSAIVATLIIILLTLVSVGIIWAVINNIVERGAEEIELGQYTLDLQIKAAQIQNGDITVVVVRRNPGQGNFIGMNFVFSDGQNSEIIREDTVLKELEEKSFTFRLTKISTANLKTVSVVPIFEMESGRESLGNIADTFDVPANKSIGTGGAVAPPEGNFAALGYTGAGKMEYGPFSSDSPKLPKFKKAIVDPLDVLPGFNQTFIVYVSSPYSIVDVTSVTELDNSVLDLDFNKIDGYEENGELIEVWSASWIVNDTHSIEYKTKITATDSGGNSNFVVLTWTDDCQAQLTHGGNDQIAISCTTGTNVVAGLDGGSLTIATGITLTIDSGATWAFNNGTSIFPIGTIVVNGTLKKGYLFYFDSDGDAYALNSTYKFSTSSSLAGYVRAKDAVTWISDCNDTNSVVQMTRTPQYNDIDGDTYTVAGSSFCGSASTWGNSACTTAGSDYAKNSTGSCLIIMPLSGTDCYDYNSSAHPGQTAYFTQSRGDTSFDYDCSGTATKDVTSYQEICVKTGVCTDALNCPWCDPGAWVATPACGVGYNDYYYGDSCVATDWCLSSSPYCPDEERAWSCTFTHFTVACH